jgi:hypothetical protein
VDKVQKGSQEMQNFFEEFLMGWKRAQRKIKSPMGQSFSKQDRQTKNYWLWGNLINIPLQIVFAFELGDFNLKLWIQHSLIK